MPSIAGDSDRSSVSGRSSTSRTSRGSKRGSKRASALQTPLEPIEERKTSYTPNMLPAGLSQLGRSADGLQPAFLTLTLTGTDLATAAPVATYPALQRVVLCDNRLTELRDLGSLRHLTHLDVSGNKLTQVLDLRLAPGGGPTNLRSADFSRNQLDMLRDLSPFSRLTTLAVAHNRLERVGAGLAALSLLKVLDLSHNRLVSCRGLEGLSSLRELRLEHNWLRSLEPLGALGQLQVLHVSHNRLSQLRGLAPLTALRSLDVSYNALGRLEQLCAVRGAGLLGCLDLRGNPLDRAVSVRLHVVHLLPQVVQLDGAPVDSMEKVLAANMHGADAEGLRLIRRKYFPNGELDDGGGAVPPLAAGLVAAQAEEELAADGAARNALIRLDAWAASIRPEAILSAPGGPSIVTLADQLASVCVPARPLSPAGAPTPAAAPGGASGAGNAAAPRSPQSHGSTLTPRSAGAAAAGGYSDAVAGEGADPQAQLQRARVCWRWVVTHVAATAALESTWDVERPLFGSGPQAIAAERVLLGDSPPPSTPTTPPPPRPPSTSSGNVPRPPPTAPAPSPPGHGTWAERVARLFTLLCRACELDAVPIPGYWKHPSLPPGERVASHNHCWAGVKVNGRWRLVDPTAAVLAGGHCPFFVPPDAFIYSYWPLEAAWQLLPEPLSQEVWWQLPYATLAFFAEGCQLGGPELAAVNVLPAVREGGTLPAFQLSLAAPRTRGCHLVHRLLAAEGNTPAAPPPTCPPQKDSSSSSSEQTRGSTATARAAEAAAQAAFPGVAGSAATLTIAHNGNSTGSAYNCAITAGSSGLGDTSEQRRRRRVLAEWPPREAGVPAYAFQQVVAGKRGQVEVCFGPDRHLATRHQLWVSLPGPGEYEVEVVHVRQLPGGGGGGRLRLRLVEEQLLLRVKVVLPPIAPHDAEEDGILHSPAVLRTPLPYASSYFREAGCQLVSPPPPHPLEADRQEPFNVVVPGASRVALAAEGLEQLIELAAVEDAAVPCTFATSLQVPRAPTATLLAYVHDPQLSTCAWLPLVQIRVLPQSQHMVFSPVAGEVAEVDPEDPHMGFARELFKALDRDMDGQVTRREILAAFRRNRQHADVLKCPARIRQDDGTFDKFIDVFLQIDTGKLGSFSFNELAAYMGVLPSGMYEYSDEEEEEYDSGDEGEPEEEEEDGGGGAEEAAGGAESP